MKGQGTAVHSSQAINRLNHTNMVTSHQERYSQGREREWKKRKTSTRFLFFLFCTVIMLQLSPGYSSLTSPWISLFSLFGTSSAQAAICVPQLPSDLLVPHETWVDEQTILKGVAGDVLSGSYYWEFGDGTTSSIMPILYPDNLSITHTFTMDAGTLLIARLHVIDEFGNETTDEYRILIKEKTLDVEVNKAIDDGLWWLYTQKEVVADYSLIPSTSFTAPDDQQGLLGEYFNNTTLSGAPALTRVDPAIDFNWGSGSPGTGVNVDFSVLWTGTIHIPEGGFYSFASNNDDGTRLYLDGNLLIDDWTGHPPVWRYSSAIYLAAGEHDFRLEFFDGAAGAQARIYWASTVSYRWRNNASVYTSYYANTTASAVQAFEINGHLETGDPAEDPYVNVVRGGIDYLMTTLTSANMTEQAGGHPEDYNNDGDGSNDGGNGIGLSVNSNRSVYETGAVIDALVASGMQDTLVRTGGANVLGRRYHDIVQDMVDMYSWGQADYNNGGGWRYSWHQWPDNSASQWAAIGMAAAERHFDCKVPDWVKSRNNDWLNYSFNGTGFGYTGRGSGWGTTPSGLVQLAFDGFTITDNRWQAAEASIAGNWSNFVSNQRNNRYYSYYAFVKAMRLALPQEVTHLASNGFDWYGDETAGLAKVLTDRQNGDGSWPYDGWPYVGTNTAGAWNVIILTRTLFEKPPVGIIHAEPNPGAVGQAITLDATGSYHVDPAKEIVQYLWDFDASDGVDFEHPDATGSVVTAAFSQLQDYTISLKVVDDSTPERFDTTSTTLHITIPPHPPTAVIGGPYVAITDETIQVDGSGSYDIDQAEGDVIIAWDWESNMVAPYDYAEAHGIQAVLPGFSESGRYDIILRVTDNTENTFPSAGEPNLTDTAYGEINVFQVGVTDLASRVKATKCQLTWTHIQAPLYEILRSGKGANQGFELIGTTDSTYSTFIDYNVVMYKDYWYRIRSEINGQSMLSAPVHIYSAGRIRNLPPVITSEPVLDGFEQTSYLYDVQAEDPEGTTLTYVLDTAPDGMSIDSAAGLISWRPSREQTGLNDVVVRVSDARGASASQFFQIFVDPRTNTAPVPEPDGPYSGLIGESLTFTGTAVDPEGDSVVEYRWAFGDGTVGSGQTVTHPYSARGSYVVTLYATDDRGATGFTETSCQIGEENRPPIADAGGPYEGEVNQPILVDGSLSYDPDGDSLSYTWNSNTTIPPQEGVQVYFTFDTVGPHTVSLTVDDAQGGSNTVEVDIVVTPPNEPPIAAFTSEPFLWNNLTFDGTDSYDPENRPIISWQWDFGDGVSTTGAMVSHVYSAAGDYTVRLTVTDEKGAGGVSEQTVFISHPTPNAAPEIDAGGPYTVPTGTPVTLTATGADPDGDSLTFTWSYDGQDQQGQTLQLIFDTVGSHDVLLTADDGYGGLVTDTAGVVVFDPASSGSDQNPPEVSITQPAGGEVLNGVVFITGSVTDENLVSWVLEYAPADTDQWQTIATGTEPVINDVLGEIDAGLLEDDLYRFRLRAQDLNYSVDSWIQCEVHSPLELGRFSLEYVDMGLSLAGIPVKVIRRYDTLDSSKSGDFGYGWKLGAVDPEIRETVPVAPQEETLGFFVASPYRVGTRVYLTDPDGKRIGFAFEPTPSPSLLGTVYIPKFTPDPGVHDRLETDSVALTLKADGTYVFFLIGFNYNPTDFRLVRKDGTTYHFNQFNGLQRVTDLNSNELVYTETGIFHSSGESVQFSRDAEGRIAAVIDPAGKTIRYAYDAAGDLVSVTDQENLSSQYSYYTDPAHYLNAITDSLGRETARYEYDADGRIIAFTNALGDRFEQAYDPAAFSGTFTDANGNVTELFYDASGNLISEVDPLGGEIVFTYDAEGNKTSVTDQNDNTTSFTYDDRGNVLTETDASGQVTTYTYDASNHILSAVDPLGRRTTGTYDSRGNMISLINPAGHTAALSYDSYGRITELIDFNGSRTVYEYTAGIAASTRIINPDGTTREYTYRWDGQIVSVTDESGGQLTRSYDANGRLSSETDALGNTITFLYDGHLIVGKVDPQGNTTSYAYDSANRIIMETDPLGGITTFTYDPNGNRLSVVDPVGNTTRFTYDTLNRLVMKTDPLNRNTVYTYDAVGNPIVQIDRNNRRREFTYNSLYQLVQERWLEGTATVNVMNFGYDSVGNRTFIGDQFSSLFFTYDAVNNLLSANNSGTPRVPSVELTYGYDANGNPISVEDSLGVRVDSVYDSRNRLSARTWQGTGMAEPVRVDVAYNALGNQNELDRFADISGLSSIGSSAFSYDGLGRLTGLTHAVVNGGGRIIADYEYSYNTLGLLTSETHHGQAFVYSYDAAGQLTGSANSDFDNENFTYDAGGNPVGNGFVVGPSNRIAGDGIYTYDYDAEGNLIRKTETATGLMTTYVYDHRNRLTSVIQRSGSGELVSDMYYTYDGLDRRIVTTVNSQTVFTVYDGENVWADFDATAALATRYLFGDETDSLFARSRPTGDTSWYLTDRLGTIRDLVETDGTLLNHVDFDSFGGVLAQTDAAQGDRFLFTGREYGRESGLYYYRGRYYDPLLGRFISEDPTGFDGGDVNLYRYVKNSPLNGTDPTGEQAMAEFADLLCGALSAGSFAIGVNDIYVPLFKAVIDAIETGHYQFTINPAAPIAGIAIPCGLPYTPPTPDVSGGN